MCNCITRADGNVVFCDECTATVQAILKYCGVTSIELVNPLTPGEYQDIKAVMTEWQMDQGQQGEQA